MLLNRRALEIVSTTAVALTVAVAVYLYALTVSSRLQHEAEQAAIPRAALGQRAPQFQVATTAGFFDLASASTPVFLEIFATWCAHCQAEVPTIDRLYARYRGRVAFVAVSGSNTAMDGFSAASESDVLGWRARFRVAYPVAYDPSERVADLYLQGAFPTIAIVDRAKIVRYLASGALSYAVLDAALRGVLPR